MPDSNETTAIPSAPPAGAQADRIGGRFIERGLLTPEQVQQVAAYQAEHGTRFGEAAVRLGLLTEADVQAVLSEQFNYATARDARAAIDASLAIARDPFGLEAEAVRELRAELLNRLDGAHGVSIAVVSPNPGEGKSYLAASLALAFSQSGRRTLLVNANLRPSGRTRLFTLPDGGGPGLSSMLAQRAPAEPGVQVPGFPLLNVLEAGPPPPNPTEILSAPSLRNLLARFAGEFAVFILDTPAALASSDAQIVAGQADACVLVGRQHHTRLADLHLTHQRLQTAGAQVLGSVYNSFDADADAGARRLRLRRG